MTVMAPEGLLDRVDAHEVQRISPSIIGSADICLARAGFDRDPNVPRTTGEARIVGTIYHAGLEDYYRCRKDAGEPSDPKDFALDAALRAWANETEDFDGWETSKAEAWDRVAAMLAAYFDGHHYWAHGYEVLGVEQVWIAPLTDRWVLKGVVDLVLEGPQGIILVDHKTAGRKWPSGKESARKNAQAVIYCWAWWSLTGQLPVGCYFDVMTYKGDFDRRMSTPTSEAMSAVLNKTIGLTQIFDAVPREMLPANPSSNLCSEKWCDHWYRCPFGAALMGT